MGEVKTHTKNYVNEREKDIFILAEKHGLTPKLIEIQYDKTIDFFTLITEKYDYDLDDYLEKHPEAHHRLKFEAHVLLDRLHQLGYAHSDIHAGNFVVKGEKLAMIDFGESRKLAAVNGRHFEKVIELIKLFPYHGPCLCQYEHSNLEYMFWEIENDENICYNCGLRLKENGDFCASCEKPISFQSNKV